MPVEFLSDEQAAAFGQYSGEPPRSEIERFFYLDDAARDLIGLRRGAHNRLGFALQLGTVRFLGTFLSDPLAVPAGILDYVAAQLDVADPSVVTRYVQRLPTVYEHAREIRFVYGYRDLAGSVLDELEGFVFSRAWTHGEGSAVLFEQATMWLRREKVLLPGVTTLVRLVQSSRERAQSRLYEVIAAAADRADPQLPSVLRGLLSLEQGGRSSRLESLRAGPTRVSGPSLDMALQRAASVQKLGVGTVDLSAVPTSRVRSLARYGLGAKAQTLQRLAEPRRSATLVATVAALGESAVDDALDLFDLLMASRVLGPSKRAAAVERLATLPAFEKASTVLARVGAEFLGVLDAAGEHVEVAAAWAALEQFASRDQIVAAVSIVSELVPDPTGAEGAMREQMVRRYRTVAPFLRLLATTIPWGSTDAGRPVLEALAGIEALRGRRRIRAGEIDDRLVPPAWRAAVFGRAADTEVDRDAWVVCVLEQLRMSLRRRDVFATVSARWGDPRARLLAGPAWHAVRDQLLTSLSLDTPVIEHLAAKLEVLNAGWQGLAAAIAEAPSEASVRLVEGFDGKVKLAVSPLPALEVPESLTALRAQVAGMLPRVDLPEILLEVHSWTGFLDAYKHASGSAARMGDLSLSLAAVLISQACNVGLTPVIAEAQSALTRDRLGYVEANYVRAETHAAANARLIQTQASVPIARSWGGGLLASVDGLRFVVPVRTINAAPMSLIRAPVPFTCAEPACEKSLHAGALCCRFQKSSSTPGFLIATLGESWTFDAHQNSQASARQLP